MNDISPEEWQEAIAKCRRELLSRPAHCPLCGGPATAFQHKPTDLPENFFTWVQVCEQQCTDGKPMFVTAAHALPHETNP